MSTGKDGGGGTAKTTPVALDLGQRRGKSRRSGERSRRLGDSSPAAPCSSPLLTPRLYPAQTAAEGWDAGRVSRNGRGRHCKTFERTTIKRYKD